MNDNQSGFSTQGAEIDEWNKKMNLIFDQWVARGGNFRMCGRISSKNNTATVDKVSFDANPNTNANYSGWQVVADSGGIYVASEGIKQVYPVRVLLVVDGDISYIHFGDRIITVSAQK